MRSGKIGVIGDGDIIYADAIGVFDLLMQDAALCRKSRQMQYVTVSLGPAALACMVWIRRVIFHSKNEIWLTQQIAKITRRSISERIEGNTNLKSCSIFLRRP